MTAISEIKRLKNMLLDYLSNVKIKFEEGEHHTDIVMTYEASALIPLMESYLKLCDMPFSRPCGPCIQLASSDASIIKEMISQHSNNKYFSQDIKHEISDDLKQINWILFSRKVVNYENFGKTNAGWKLEIKLSDTGNADLIDLFGSYSGANKENTIRIYFRNKAALEDCIAKINHIKQLI